MFIYQFHVRKWENKSAPIELVTRSEIFYILTSKTDKKVKKEQKYTCSKNDLAENMNTNSATWKFCSYIEYRISFTTLCLQKLVKNCWMKVNQIFLSKWCNIWCNILLSKEVSPKSKTLVNFESLGCKMAMSILL